MRYPLVLLVLNSLLLAEIATHACAADAANESPHNLSLWNTPAALVGEDIAGPLQPGGLGARILQAALANDSTPAAQADGAVK